MYILYKRFVQFHYHSLWTLLTICKLFENISKIVCVRVLIFDALRKNQNSCYPPIYVTVMHRILCETIKIRISNILIVFIHRVPIRRQLHVGQSYNGPGPPWTDRWTESWGYEKARKTCCGKCYNVINLDIHWTFYLLPVD